MTEEEDELSSRVVLSRCQVSSQSHLNLEVETEAEQCLRLAQAFDDDSDQLK